METSKESSRLYCHYFHTSNTCRKGNKCDFLHGTFLDGCPNQDRCPIKVYHKPADDKKPLSNGTKTENRDRVVEKKVEEVKIVEKQILKPSPLKERAMVFQVLMSKWEDQDIVKDEKPKQNKSETTSSPSKVPETIKHSKTNGKTVEVINKKDRKEDIETQTTKGETKNQQKTEDISKGDKKIKKSEQEEEEVKENFVKQETKTVVIKRDLPDHINEFIRKNYSSNEEAKNFITNFYFLNQDMKAFLPIYENFFPKLELDLMFIVDCTGSMSSWIDAVKLEISGIVAAIKNEHQGSTIRVCFVGYRDYGDTERYSIFRFSDNMESFQDFVGKVTACGGNDAAEDVAGGFKHANTQDWKSKAKYAVLLADAPAHGIIYHGDSADFYDRYPKGDPDGVDLKTEFKNLIKKGVKLYAVEIMNSTKKMFDLFKSYNKEVNGQELDITKLGSSTQGFGQFISQTASQTLSQSYTKESKEDPQGAFFKALKLIQGQNTATSVAFLERYNFREGDATKQEQEDHHKKDVKLVTFNVKPQKVFPNFTSSQNLQAVCHTYFIVQDKGVPINWRKPLVQNSSIKTSIKVNSVPFAEGAMRYAFHAEDTLLKQKLVAKLNKKQNKNDVELDKQDMVKDLESQFICQHIVNSFNERASEHVQTTANLKNFVHCFIYEIKDSSHPYKYYSAENYMEGEYVKFNNNAGWCNLRFDEPGLLSQALSHFSYQLTEGYLMIVDLQGVGGLLTDPQIHCLDQHRFGAGNLGYQGMFKFFLSHSCNKYCQNLNLVHPKLKELPRQLKFFSHEVTKPVDPKKKVFCMCDLCKVPFETNANYLYNKRVQCQEKYCHLCDIKREETLKSAKCITCNSTFKSSAYWFQMKRTDFPELCGPCRKKRRERMRAELN